jgi:hypothetical protein
MIKAGVLGSCIRVRNPRVLKARGPTTLVQLPATSLILWLFRVLAWHKIAQLLLRNCFSARIRTAALARPCPARNRAAPRAFSCPVPPLLRVLERSRAGIVSLGGGRFLVFLWLGNAEGKVYQ